MLIGYARVSKADGSQSLDLQRDALRDAGVDQTNLYHDLASGARDDRPGLDNCLRALRKDDVLVVWESSIASAASSLGAGPLRPRSRPARARQPGRANVDTTHHHRGGRLVLGIFAALAEFEPGADPRTHNGRTEGRSGPRPQGRQEVRAVESSGAAGPGRDGTSRHLIVRPVCGQRPGFG